MRQGKKMRIIEEYEVDTAAIEAFNGIAKRAAIETGQEQETINLTCRMLPV